MLLLTCYLYHVMVFSFVLVDILVVFTFPADTMIVNASLTADHNHVYELKFLTNFFE